MKRTPLYDQHVRDASAVINLKGFARAMQYAGHATEHRATREKVSLCDVSHMPRWGHCSSRSTTRSPARR